MRALLLSFLLLGGTTALASAGRRDWIGSAACATCHPAVTAAWQHTPQASTGARLTTASGGRCQICHATGEAPAGPTVEVGVGCEACHGSGGHYAEDDLMRNRELATALGLTDVTTASARAGLCARCHRPGLRRSTDELLAAAHPATPVTAQTGAR